MHYSFKTLIFFLFPCVIIFGLESQTTVEEPGFTILSQNDNGSKMSFSIRRACGMKYHNWFKPPYFYLSEP